MVLWIIVSSVLFHALQVSLITTERGDVRLVGGASRCTGDVEMKHQGVWRPLYGYTWTSQLLSVVCRQLGCGSDGSVRWRGGSTRQPAWWIHPSCKGSESAVVECRGRVVDHSSSYTHHLTCSDLVHGGWTGWSSWSQCSTSCIPEGRASNRTRSRSCTNPAPSSSGNSCVGNTNETGRCDHLTSCSAMFSQCGRAEPGAASRILGGGGSVAGTHPWQVSLQRRNNCSSQPFKHHCGGSLIASCWVLTAAHCIHSSKEMQVVLGGVYHKKTIEVFDQVIPVVRAVIHPDYRKSKTSDGQLNALHNDVALLQLQATQGPLCAMETRYVKTACLPNQLFPDDKECVITGWGRTGNNKRSNRLLEASVPLISKQSCMAPHVYGNRLDDTMICAGRMEGGVDTCQGDSGGPLMCEQDGVHYIAGVVSFGEGCAQRNKPGVYANVHRYVTWINQTMSVDHIDISEDYDYSYDDD